MNVSAAPSGDRASATGSDTPLMEVSGLIKHFPGVLALRDVSFSMAAREIHALLGANGAGKSTLIKILSGAQRADSGEILLRGEPVTIDSPQQARQLGISTIHQEMTLVPHLTALRNIFLGAEIQRGPFLDETAMRRQIEPLCEEFGFDVADLDRPVEQFGALKQHVVEILKALRADADLVIMDEPTAAVTDNEREALFAHMRGLRRRGVAVLWVTHRLEELHGLADRATVMRDGAYVGTVDLDAVDTRGLVRMMLGRDVAGLAEQAADAVRSIEHHPQDTEVLAVRGMTRGRQLQDVSFTVHAGEVLGIAGLAGAGRTELARAIIGADPVESGSVSVAGRAVNIRSPRDASHHGIALVPEERKLQGIFGDLSVARNISIGSLRQVLRGRMVVDTGEESRVGQRYVKEMGIRTPSVRQKVALLSGGNQQKTVVARCLFAKPKVLIFDEPTQGVDIGAKAEIHRLIREYVAGGGAAVVISSETPELLALADRVVVMRQGRLVGEVDGCPPSADEAARQAKEEEIMTFAMGATHA